MSFPDPREISNAYHAVILTNERTERDVIALEDMQNELGALSLHSELLVQELKPAPMPIEDITTQNLQKLERLDGKLFDAIGIELDISQTATIMTLTQMISADRVVPDLLEPPRFVAYLEDIGADEVYEDPAHLQLAADVVEQVHDRVLSYDERIRRLKTEPKGNFDFKVANVQARAEFLDYFRTIRPFYINAKLNATIPAFNKLEKLVRP